jgi:hypothetical protein
MITSGLLTLVLDSAAGAFNLLLSIGAGTGLLYLLRWFWWRINAWSEIAAMASSFALAVALVVLEGGGITFAAHWSLIATVALTTAVWLAATWLGPPTDPETLRRFYQHVRPAGPGWARIRRECGNLAPLDDLASGFAGWIAGCAFVYGALFGAGHALMGHAAAAVVSLLVVLVSGIVMWRAISRLWA